MWKRGDFLVADIGTFYQRVRRAGRYLFYVDIVEAFDFYWLGDEVRGLRSLSALAIPVRAKRKEAIVSSQCK